MVKFKVDTGKCKKDDICVKVCPIKVLEPDFSGFPTNVAGRESFCISCGHCVAFCPHGAASLEGLPMETVEKLDRKLLPSPESLEMLFKSRRSVRIFSDKLVPQNDIEKLLGMVNWAPTAKNARAIRWIISSDADKNNEIKKMIAEAFEMLAEAAPNENERMMHHLLVNSWKKGNDPFLRGAGQLAIIVAKNGPWGYIDSSGSLAYFELAALSLGIGCCWAGYFTSACIVHEKLRKFLGVADDEVVGGGQMFGYQKIRPSYSAPRNPAVVSWL